MMCTKFQSKMGKSATKMTISIDRHREIQHFDGYCYKNGEISNREKMIGGKFQSKNLKISLSPGLRPTVYTAKKRSVENSKAKFAGTPETI